jgi:hypothetical protein
MFREIVQGGGFDFMSGLKMLIINANLWKSKVRLE